MNNTFYRYIRPTIFDTKRAEIVTHLHGGVCLRFELYNDKLWFTHSRCAMSELFSKDVAKCVADQRAKIAKHSKYHMLGYCGAFPITKKTSDLCSFVSSWAETWVPEVNEAAVLYHAFELKELTSFLKLIEFNNRQQECLAQDWKSSIAAAHYGEMYGKIDH